MHWCYWCDDAANALMLCWRHWFADAAEAFDALMLLMLLMRWYCWCSDDADVLMLLMHWCTTLMRWCCWCADVLMLLIRWCCWCASADASILMHWCWCAYDDGVVDQDQDQDQLADLSGAFCSSYIMKIFLQQGYEVTEVTEVTGLRKSKRFCHFQRKLKGYEVSKVSMIF